MNKSVCTSVRNVQPHSVKSTLISHNICNKIARVNSIHFYRGVESTVWKFQKKFPTANIFRQIDLQYNSLVKYLIWRNFGKKSWVKICKFPHCGKSLSKVFPSNWFRVKSFSGNVDFTEFLWQKVGSKVSKFKHSVYSAVAYLTVIHKKFCIMKSNYSTYLKLFMFSKTVHFTALCKVDLTENFCVTKEFFLASRFQVELRLKSSRFVTTWPTWLKSKKIDWLRTLLIISLKLESNNNKS